MDTETGPDIVTVFRIPHCLELVVNGATQEQTWANVFHFLTSPDVTSPTDLATIASSFNTNVLPKYLACMSNQSTVTSFHLRTIYPDPAINYEYDFPLTPPQPGTVNQDQMAENSCGVISWRSGAVGRSFRGRTYLPGLPEGGALGSTVTPTQVALWASLAAQLLLEHGGGGTVQTFLRVASRKLQVITPILTALIDLYTKSQRDRLPQERRHKRKRAA